QFPELQNYIGGEESNKFENGLGEMVVVEVQKTQGETAGLLCRVLDGNVKAAALLAEAIHQDVVIHDQAIEELTINVPTQDLGIWIDPIDSTNQYIKGETDVKPRGEIYPSGLKSAEVLIGVYDRHTGHPIIGVVNEPFHQQDPQTLRWKGRSHWGICYSGFTASSVKKPDSRAGLSVVMSRSDQENLKQSLAALCGDELYYASGAGYKILCVIAGHVDAYVFSSDTTFKWDSCAPHAIVRALGGGVVDLSQCLNMWKNGLRSDLPELTYNKPVEEIIGADKWANKGGLVAFLDSRRLEALMNAISKIL
uniref:inositol-1,4-bisphosphate 1-phosphatase n=1 Tax=Latimeria chalumnae TaxID=7897 RepID=H3BHB3_LATCH